MAAHPTPSADELLAHAGWLAGLAASLVADRASADDLVQDTWFRALARPPSGAGPLRPWLARVAANLASNRRRADQRRADREPLSYAARDSIAPDVIAGELELQRQVAASVLALDEPLRTTVVLRYFRGLNSKQIEALQSVSASTVRWRLARALELLRADLDRRSGGRRESWHPALALVASHGTQGMVATAAGITGAWIMGSATKFAVAACAAALVAFGVWSWIANAGRTQSAAASAATPSEAVEGLASASREVPPVLEPGAARTEADLPVAAAAPASSVRSLLRIRVVAKENGAPLFGARIMATPRERAPGSSIRMIEGPYAKLNESPLTARDGWAEIEVQPNAAHDLTAGFGDRLSAGYSSGGNELAALEVEALSPGETRNLVIELRSEMDLVFCARVVDAQSRAPIAGARATIREGALPEETARARTTDTDGRFEVRVQGWNHPALSLAAEGFARTWVLPCEGHATAETAFVVELARPATLRIAISDASGAPIEGAKLYAKVASYELAQPAPVGMTHPKIFEDDTFTAKTDAGGIAVLADLPPRVRIELTAYQGRETLRREPAAIVLQPGERRELTWRMGSASRIYGTVTEADGRAAAGQEIWILPARALLPTFLGKHDTPGRRTATCAADGTYEIADVPAGAWWVGPASVRGQNDPWQDGIAAPFASVVEVSSPPSGVRADLTLTRNLCIRGRVEDPDGQPVPFVGIFATHESKAMLFSSSGEDGSFVIGPLVDGSYTLRATMTPRPGTTSFADSRALTVRAGTIDLVLRMQRGCKISGRVVDALTGQAVDAQLVISPAPGQEGVAWGAMFPESTRANGFDVGGLTAAEYSLTARTVNGEVGWIRSIVLAPGEQRSELEIRVAAGAKVAIVYEGAASSGGFSLLIDGRIVASDGIPSGARRTFAVPAGSLVARMWRSPGVWSDSAFELQAGETKELRFDTAWK